MKLKKLAVAICELEGKKHEVNVADVSEIIRCLRVVGQSLNDDEFEELNYNLWNVKVKHKGKK